MLLDPKLEAMRRCQHSCIRKVGGSHDIEMKTPHWEEGDVSWSGVSSFNVSYYSGYLDFTLSHGEVRFRPKATQREE